MYVSDEAFPSSVTRRRGPPASRELAEAEDQRGNFAKSTAIWRALADKGDANACQVLGQRYETGQGVTQDFVEAAAWFRRAADQDVRDAQAKLGEIYFFGRGGPASVGGDEAQSTPTTDGSPRRSAPKAQTVEQDYRQAAHWNLMAADAGDTDAQVRWAFQCAAGLGLDQDFIEAEYWFLQAAKTGHDGAAFALGLMHASGHAKASDVAKAVKWFEKAARGGHAAAKLSVGLLHLSGQGLEENPKRAAELIREAAESGELEPTYFFGQGPRSGAGASAGAPEADSWLTRAAARGHVHAMVAVAGLLLQAPAGDAATAAGLLRQAAYRGDAEAQLGLGRLHLEGRGVPLDLKEAAWWFETAAEAGSPEACLELGVINVDGGNGQLEFAAAARWFRRGYDLGNIECARHLGLMHLNGEAPEPDLKYGVNLLEAAAEAGNIRASWRLHEIYLDGENADEVLAQHWLITAAESGDEMAVRQLAAQAETRDPLALPMDRLIPMLTRIAQEGDIAAQEQLGRLYADADSACADESEALCWFSRAAEGGSLEAKAWLREALRPRRV